MGLGGSAASWRSVGVVGICTRLPPAPLLQAATGRASATQGSNGPNAMQPPLGQTRLGRAPYKIE